MDILKRIYELRVDRGWSEYQLAEASEISQSTISSWYRKDMLPSIGSLEKICKGLGITMSQFFDDSNGSGSLTDDQRPAASRLGTADSRTERIAAGIFGEPVNGLHPVRTDLYVGKSAGSEISVSFSKTAPSQVRYTVDSAILFRTAIY